MFIFLTIAAILLPGLWLILRAHARRINHAQNASLLAQLEEMESSLNKLDDESAQSDRELEIILRSLEPSPPKLHARNSKSLSPKPPRNKPRAQSTQTPISDNHSPITDSLITHSPATQTPENSNIQTAAGDSIVSVPAASTRESSDPNPKRRRGKRPPQTLAEYEATRKPLAPLNYNRNSRAAQLFDELFKRHRIPNAPSETIAISSPSAVSDPHRPKPRVLCFCLFPLRLVARCCQVVVRPVLYVGAFASRFFARPKPPPPPMAIIQNRAA